MEGSPQKLPIKAWDVKDRPREKLLNSGENTLSNAELLAILIGSGSAKESAVRLMQRLLVSHHNKLLHVQQLSIEQMMTLKGIGKVKAIKIKAALALGQRLSLEKVPEKLAMTNSQAVHQVIKPMLAHLKHEEFWVLYLNQAHRLIEQQCLSKGGITQTSVDLRLALKRALELGATAMILAHNHPSGNLSPSAADKSLTRKFKHAATTLDLRVIDHLIVAAQGYLSFADEGLL
ncbi:MAG: DNA repair protein RadC [Flavobacteriaceae bacterium]|jgi:DNA repair protein RadC